MARPTHRLHVKAEDRKVEIAEFQMDKISHLPALLKHYTGFIEAVIKAGGYVDTPYGSKMVIRLPKDNKQLDEQLKSDQYRWDDMQKHYRMVVAGEEVASWRHSSIKEWAKDEGLADPFIVHNNDEAEAEAAAEANAS